MNKNTCHYASSGCNYPESECIGVCMAESHGESAPRRSPLVLPVALIILVCLVLACLPAFAVEVEGGIGNTQWTKPPNTQYWQYTKDSNLGANSFDLNSPSYYIGVTDYLDVPKWMPPTRWRLGYQYLGNVSSVAKATSDHIYNGVDGCVGPCPTDPLSWATFNTYSSARGIKASVAPEWHIGGGVKFFVEGGVFAYIPQIDVKIDRCCGHTEDYYYHYKSGWNVGPTVGFGFEYGKTQLVFSWYRVDAKNTDHKVNDEIPVNFGNGLTDTFNVMLRQRFWSF